MTWIDTHCHLVSEKLRARVLELVENARLEGIGKIINIAYDPASVEMACEQMACSDILYAALGIQPHDASQFSVEAAEKIRQRVREQAKVVAIGEIGLDAYYTLSPMEKQIECFEYFLNMACEERLPVVVHVRETHRDVADRIQYFSKKGLTGVIHCFTGTKEEAAEFLDAGMFISFSGIVTFKNAKDLQEVAKFVPENRILVETDSPYLAPMPHRGKTNEPGWVRHVGEFVANLRSVSSQEFAKQTTENAYALFPGLL